MKQKVVVKLQMNDPKSRTKALKLAVGMPGVTSAKLEGEDMNQIVVIGNNVDSVSLTKLLRKKIGFTILVSVAEEEEVKKVENEPNIEQVMYRTVWGYPPAPSAPYYVSNGGDAYDNTYHIL